MLCVYVYVCARARVCEPSIAGHTRREYIANSRPNCLAIAIRRLGNHQTTRKLARIVESQIVEEIGILHGAASKGLNP